MYMVVTRQDGIGGRGLGEIIPMTMYAFLLIYLRHFSRQ